MSSTYYREFAEEKKRARILILGPYKPPLAKKRLIKLRDCLQEHGYDNTRIVEDFPDVPKYDEDPDKHFTLKSRDNIENWADILVFVFMRGAKNLGVGIELQSTISSVKNKIRNSVELHEQGTDLSTQMRGPVKISRMYSYEFQSDQQLCDLTIGFCTNVIYEFMMIS